MPTLQDCVQLNCGVQMPLLGLGTYHLHGDELRCSVDAALAAGYRAFDTAAVYGNEPDLGRALRELLPRHGLTRADVFVISKLDPADHGARALDGCLRSVERLGCGAVDLFLLHWPGTAGLDPADPRNAADRTLSWTALEDLHRGGTFRAIGVSNYTPPHLRQLLSACRVPPAVLQTECHPALCQTELRRACGEAGVALQAYSSLGKGTLLRERQVGALARECGRTPAQVLLRWAVQQGVAVLPRSREPRRVRENARVFDFELSAQDMTRLGALDCGRRFCKRDPSCVV
ncbi:aldo-keto reductase Mflv_4205 [Sardina pilchardus]|uniref:aldo-keto reductase Mflv_4205 n=1 Tax=Sardina pilchardus TaxID=27697 RepID=UPI002E13397A